MTLAGLIGTIVREKPECRLSGLIDKLTDSSLLLGSQPNSRTFVVAGRWFLFFLWLAPTALVAQLLAARTLSLPQGLPEFYVSGIVQDRAGFVWVATRDGLTRYDGRRFKLFRHQPRNSRSLANNVIIALQTVSDSTLLVHLENGTFQLFNPQTEQFKSLLPRQRLDQAGIQVNSAQLSRDGQRFWGRHERHVMHYSLSQNQITVFPFPQPDSIYAGGLLLDTTQEMSGC